MKSNADLIFYSSVTLGIVVVLAATYQVVRRLRKHRATHKPEVASKISDFYKTQNSSRSNY